MSRQLRSLANKLSQAANAYNCGRTTIVSLAQTSLEVAGELYMLLPVSLVQTKAGRDIIEEALQKALKADPADAPFPLNPEQAALWHQAQAAAYQHALEMIEET